MFLPMDAKNLHCKMTKIGSRNYFTSYQELFINGKRPSSVETPSQSVRKKNFHIISFTMSLFQHFKMGRNFVLGCFSFFYLFSGNITQNQVSSMIIRLDWVINHRKSLSVVIRTIKKKLPNFFFNVEEHRFDFFGFSSNFERVIH